MRTTKEAIIARVAGNEPKVGQLRASAEAVVIRYTLIREYVFGTVIISTAAGHYNNLTISDIPNGFETYNQLMAFKTNNQGQAF